MRAFSLFVPDKQGLVRDSLHKVLVTSHRAGRLVGTLWAQFPGQASSLPTVGMTLCGQRWKGLRA